MNAEALTQGRTEAMTDARSRVAGAEHKAKEWAGTAAAAERQRAEAAGEVETRTEEVEKAEERRKTAEGDVRTRAGEEAAAKEQVTEAAKALKDAEAELGTLTRKAEAAAKALKDAEAELETLTRKAEAAAKALKDAEAELETLTRKAEAAAKALEDAEAEVEKRAAAEGEAEERAEQAVAAARDEAQKWAKALAKAKEQMGGFEKAAKEGKEKVGPANEKQADAAAAVQKWAKPVNDAQEAVAAAQVLVEEKESECETAARARVAAETALGDREKDEGTAREQLSRAVTEQKTYAAAKAEAQEEMRKAHAAAGVHRQAENEARTEAAAAAREQLRARKAEAAAREAVAAKEKAAKDAAGAQQPEKPRFLEKAKAKTKSAFGLTNAKKRLDPSDTAILRVTAPSGVAAQAHAKDSNTDMAFGSAPQLQVESGSNVVVSVLGAYNDGRGYLSARKAKDAKGAEAHQADKDKKGKPAGFVTNALMTVSDGLKVGNAAMKNKGVAEGVAGLGEGTGVLTGVFSVGIGAREGRVIHRTKHKRRNLKEHALQDVEAVRNRALQTVLDRLDEVSAELADKTAGLSGGPQAGPTAEQLKSLGESQAEADSLRKELMEHLASGQQYAIKKQDRKIVKRAVNLGGNVVRTAGGILAVIALAGTLATPAAPAVGGVAAATLGGLAAYKGGKAGYKRATEVRHPAKWARTTLAQGETEFTEQTAENEKKGSKRSATAEFLKVTKSVGQGERQLTAQEIYALAAGPAVPVGKSVPADVRAKARELLIDLNCTWERRKETKEEWEASLNDLDQQEGWEKYIAKQLAS
ncbi:hypothetical protein [Streptomyces sp. NPDC057363]|uniref:hypothetical protein n=1 Tax=Streptomyces sp. NPDC057363 TaxID=3346107 RepID=UPI0036336275